MINKRDLSNLYIFHQYADAPLHYREPVKINSEYGDMYIFRALHKMSAVILCLVRMYKINYI